jgi:uncharacterized SAM-binding protein YcdF (DUF218 family)
MRFFLVPSNLLALAAVLGLVLFLLRLRIGALVAALSLAAIAVAALTPLGNALLTPLDERFPEWSYPPQQGIEGIIVLAGSYDRVRHAYLSTIVLEDDTEPMAMMVQLAARYPQAKIVISGGSEASLMKRYLATLGIAKDRIVAEGQSRTTAERAQYAANLLHPSQSSRWLLVTYGYRMPRAIGAFRKAGFNIFAFPVHLRTRGWEQIWQPDETATENLGKLDLAVHEWSALLLYKLRGHSDELFAAPRPDRELAIDDAERTSESLPN